MKRLVEPLDADELTILQEREANRFWTVQTNPFDEQLLNSSDFPRISIVTPNYNQGRFLEETICSVLSQGYPNLEYIIIDGGSTDNSIEIIQRYEKYLAYWVSEPDEGQYHAINKGLAKATGEIMAWLNSDDMYFPGSLKTVASIMTELTQVEWLTTLNPASLDWHGFHTGYTALRGYSKAAFLDGYYSPWAGEWIGWIQQESTFWRRSLWEKVGGYIRTEYEFAGDFDLWARFYQYADLYGTDSPLGSFRLRAGQKVRQADRYAKDANQSLADYRNKVGWSSNLLRKLAIQLKIHRIPKIKRVSESIYGFPGKRVVRKNQESPDSYWAIEEYKFL